MTRDPGSTLVMHTLASSVPAQQEQAHDLPEALPCNEQGRTNMFTIIQKNFDSNNNYVGWEVMAQCASLQHASAFAAELCNLAGVVRTLVLDDMGQVVCVES